MLQPFVTSKIASVNNFMANLSIETIRQKLKQKSAGAAGMILIHNGVVRNCTRDGKLVTNIEVEADTKRLSEVIADTERLPGILAVEVEINHGTLKVGDDIMLLGVAGDIRENCLSALSYCLNRIKSEVTRKKEHCCE